MLARLLQTTGKCGHLSYVHCDGARLPFARVLSLSLSGLAGSSGSSLSCLTSLVPWRRRRPPASPGVWCLKVYGVLRCMISSLDLIDGRGPGFPGRGRRKNLGLFFPLKTYFSPSKHTICVCIYSSWLRLSLSSPLSLPPPSSSTPLNTE